MADPYVIFPGTAGNYVSTDDVNLLDADTAHLEQSIGTWVTWTAASRSLSTDHYLFGTHSLKVTPTGAAGSNNGIQTPAEYVAVPDDGIYSYAPWVYSDEARTFDVTMNCWDSGSGVTGTVTNICEHDGSGWVQLLNGSFDLPASTATVRLVILEQRGNLPATPYWVDKVCIRTGSDPTFVPSLRIVGDIDLRAKAASDGWAAASTALLHGATGNFGYRLQSQAAGIYARYGDGSATREESSLLFTLVDGEATEIRVTYDVTSGDTVWYQDGVQVDTDTFTPGPGAPSGLRLVVGASAAGTGSMFDGKVYWVEVRDGIDGPVVARFDAGEVPQPAQLPI